MKLEPMAKLKSRIRGSDMLMSICVVSITVYCMFIIDKLPLPL